MSPAGRPGVGIPINVRLGDDLLAEIDAAASRFGMSRAAMIRGLIAAALSELPDDTIAKH